MAKFKFAGHETFPEDDFMKEVVWIDVKGEDCFFRLAYGRKVFRNGGSMWDAISAGVNKDGKKKWIKGAECNDNFFDKEVKEFLKNRSWENKQKVQQTIPQIQNSDELPF